MRNSAEPTNCPNGWVRRLRSRVRCVRMSASVANQESTPDALTPPEGHPRYPLVDSLRGIAALGVVMFHTSYFLHARDTVLGRPLAHLDSGVAIFFALTGFLLYRPFVAASLGRAPRVPVRLFYWRRALRIAPGYWVALLVLAPLIASSPWRFAPPYGLPNAAFAQIYYSSWVGSGTTTAWSICIEVVFYLLLPLYAA